MLKRIIIILYCLFYLSCNVLNFTIKDLPIGLNRIKTNGYYVYESKNYQGLDIKFIYTNGIFYNTNSYYKNVDSAIYWFNVVNKRNFNHTPIMKSFWGYYRIIGDSIIFEKPEPAQGYPILRHTGKILNDTTFYINTSQEENKELVTFEKLYYHFKSYSPKPDSTNNFLTKYK